MHRNLLTLVLLGTVAGTVRADPPVASYMFPSGGQRGQTVAVRIGGLNLHQKCGFEMLGPGVEVEKEIRRMERLWFEGPVLPLPDSQQPEDYPVDMSGKVRIAGDAPLGVRPWRLWTSQGVTAHLKFVVGDLPEIIEDETSTGPVEVKLPLTINGRIFPREDVDVWTFEAKQGQSIRCEVMAARLGSPLDARLEVRDPQGRRIAENDDYFGADPFLRFIAPVDGRYQVRIHDTQFHGGSAYVYRLTLTAGPAVDRTYPLGGRRGAATTFELTGQAVPATTSIELPKDGPRDLVQRLNVNGQLTNPFLLDLDDLPEVLEAEPNDTAEKAQRVEVPAVLNGRIGKPGDVDCWAVSLRKGEAWEFDLRASRLGSPLQGVLILSDETGKDLTRAEADPTLGDPVLRFTPPADGRFFLRVEERFRARGGADFAYRLRVVRPSAPDFRLKPVGEPRENPLGDAVTLLRGGQSRLRIQVERLGGFAGAIALEFDGLPAGVTVAPPTIAANQNTVDLTFKADATARIQVGPLKMRGTAKIADNMVSRPVLLSLGRSELELDAIMFAVAMPTPFKVIGHHDMRWASRGTMFHRRYRIERNGFGGPLQVSLSDRQARHLQGVTGPTITVPAGESEFDYGVLLAPWMETGRTSRVCVMAVGVVKDADGSEHTVSFTSIQPNEQIIVVVEPERLGLAAEKESLTAKAGQAVEVPLRVTRGKGLQGPVTVVLTGLARGITAEPLVIAADKDHAVLTLRFAADWRGAGTVPLVLRATVMDNGEPVVAEAKVEVLRDGN